MNRYKYRIVALLFLGIITLSVSCVTTEPAKVQAMENSGADACLGLVDASNGNWWSIYYSTNGDGKIYDYVIFRKSVEQFEATRWTISKCNRCKSPEDRKPYISDFPQTRAAENQAKLMVLMKLTCKANQLIEAGNSPLGEDIVFEPKPKFILEPFEAECAKRNFSACMALAEMFSIDGKTKKALTYWSKACKGGIGAACHKK